MSVVLVAPVLASDAPPTDPAPASTTTPAPATTGAPAAAVTDSVVVFGIISLSADHKQLTLTDGKGTVTKLIITAKTEATIDLHKCELTSLSTTQSVRVTYTGDKVDSIDELTPDKKKKKKLP
jgi:hypothetical protein